MHPSQVPVEVVPYDSEWINRFEVERVVLLSTLGSLVDHIQHFGSTSVPNLWAKPTIDILLGTHVWPWTGDDALKTLGYTFYKEPSPHWRVYLKAYGDDPRGIHLHITEHGSDHWRRHILLRDYLRTHPNETDRYSAFKRDAAIRFGGDRGEYQYAKTVLVQELEGQAEGWAVRRDESSEQA